ncbi:MAG TPA: hypothetical protein VH599_04860 [Ktedonobacterales bacterium]|jgi:hypothetical protein
MNQHLVAAGNYVLGTSNFLILNLPQGWRLFTGLHPAEVDNSTQVLDTRWVTNGRASYLLHSGAPGGKVELAVRVGQGEVSRWLNPLRQDGAASQMLVGRHQAFYRLRQRGQPWLSRSRGDTLEMALYCDTTRRTLALEFSGPEREEDRHALLEALGDSRCH